MNQYFLQEARKGNVYHSHNTTHGAVTALSTTCTGLVLANPINSGRDLIVAQATFVGSTLTTLENIGLVVATVAESAIATATTAAVIHNARLQGGDNVTGTADVYSIATLTSTPIWLRPLGACRVTGAVEGQEAFVAEFDGTLIVGPGMYIAFATLTTARTGLCSFTWAEARPIG